MSGWCDRFQKSTFLYLIRHAQQLDARFVKRRERVVFPTSKTRFIFISQNNQRKKISFIFILL
jgi:hypothetical protein